LSELADVVRRDVLTLLIMRVISALYWFHPIAWSLQRIARRECERACDDVVLAAGTCATEYADHLLTIARSLPATDPLSAVTVAISRPSELEGRLLAILQRRAGRGAISRTAFALIACGMALIALPLAALRVVAQPAEHF